MSCSIALSHSCNGRSLVSQLNEFQGQRVETTFAHVDRLLIAVEALALAIASPFAREQLDISNDRRSAVAKAASSALPQLSDSSIHVGA